MRATLSAALCLLLLQTGCSDDMKWSAVERLINANYPDTPTITTDSLAARLADSTAAQPLLLDARSPEEFAVSHLPEARRIDPDAEAYPALDSLAADAPIVVYCSVGYRSAGVVQRIRAQGFSEASNLRGSIFRWANEGRTVVRDSEAVRQVHPFDATWGQLLEEDLRAYEPSGS
jgi:rhodanese-related sulfurtransferase